MKAFGSFQVLYVLCFTRPRYQVSVYRTTGPLVYIQAVVDQLPRSGKRELICLLFFTCNYVVSVRRGLLLGAWDGLRYFIVALPEPFHIIILPLGYLHQYMTMIFKHLL